MQFDGPLHLLSVGLGEHGFDPSIERSCTSIILLMSTVSQVTASMMRYNQYTLLNLMKFMFEQQSWFVGVMLVHSAGPIVSFFPLVLNSSSFLSPFELSIPICDRPHCPVCPFSALPSS
jgi:hypothetical protein